MKKRHILVTGGAGYIGSVLVGNLLAVGYKVRVLDIFMFGGESLLSFMGNKNLGITVGDIRDERILKQALNGITDIIHLAALVGEPACKENPKVTREINLQATKKLAALARSKDISRFIFASTCSNYGISSPDEEATEEAKLCPLSLYAETKIAAEKTVLSLKDKNFHPAVLRLATVFGLSPRMRFNLLVNEFAREAALGKKITVKNKKAWRPFLHTHDASNAFVTVLNAPLSKTDGQIFNVVGENIQKEQLAQLAKKFNPSLEIAIEDGGVDDKRDYRVSGRKFCQTLGWKPSFTVEQGFREIIEAVKKRIFFNPYEFKYNGWYNKEVLE